MSISFWHLNRLLLSAVKHTGPWIHLNARIFSTLQGLCLRHRAVRHESGRCTAKAQGNASWRTDLDMKVDRFRYEGVMSCSALYIFQLDLSDSWFESMKMQHVGSCCPNQDRTYHYNIRLLKNSNFPHCHHWQKILRQKPLEQSEMLRILKQARCWNRIRVSSWQILETEPQER